MDSDKSPAMIAAAYPELSYVERDPRAICDPNVTFHCHFYAAHRLAPPYEGKCGNIHGHNYQVKVEIEAFGLDASGFVVGYDDIKKVVDLLDHTLILYNKDPLYDKIVELGLAVFPVESNPTTEYLSHFIALTIMDNVVENNLSIHGVTVTLNETDNIQATSYVYNSHSADYDPTN